MINHADVEAVVITLHLQFTGMGFDVLVEASIDHVSTDL
jgi:hypothetical protein